MRGFELKNVVVDFLGVLVSGGSLLNFDEVMMMMMMMMMDELMIELHKTWGLALKSSIFHLLA
jgi:hypothetical protein